MTQDEIIEMAKEAGGVAVKPTPTAQEVIFTQCLDIRLFAKLVAAKEREACKALAKEYAAEYKEGGRLYPMLNGGITKTVASACDHIVYIIGEREQA
jgi:hypothetical protein